MNKIKKLLFGSKLNLVIELVLLAIISLSTWGFITNSSSKAEVAKAQSAIDASQKSATKANSSLSQLSGSSPTSSANPQTSTSSSTKSSPKPSTSTSSAPSSSSTQPIVLSDADKSQAAFDISVIHGRLEAYNATNGYYPSDIAATNFSNNCTGDCGEITPPAGIHFVYSPTPSGLYDRRT